MFFPITLGGKKKKKETRRADHMNMHVVVERLLNQPKLDSDHINASNFMTVLSSHLL